MPDAPSSNRLVAGLFAHTSDAELALDNLDEAEYAAAGISVVAQDPAQAKQLVRVAGPLSGLSPDQFVQRLEALGMSAADTAAYRAGLASGGIAVTVTAPPGSEEDAAGILRDQKAQRVSTLPSNALGGSS